jgi:cytochrome c
MNRLLLCLALAASAAPALAADYAQVQPVLAKNGCESCHGLSTQVNGPSWLDIANRYLNKPDARTYLAGKIRNGSANVWGAAAMPPNNQVNELDMKTIVEWLASGAGATPG